MFARVTLLVSLTAATVASEASGCSPVNEPRRSSPAAACLHVIASDTATAPIFSAAISDCGEDQECLERVGLVLTAYAHIGPIEAAVVDEAIRTRRPGGVTRIAALVTHNAIPIAAPWYRSLIPQPLPSAKEASRMREDVLTARVINHLDQLRFGATPGERLRAVFCAASALQCSEVDEPLATTCSTVGFYTFRRGVLWLGLLELREAALNAPTLFQGLDRSSVERVMVMASMACDPQLEGYGATLSAWLQTLPSSWSAWAALEPYDGPRPDPAVLREFQSK